MNLKPFIALLYRRLPLPYALQIWLIRRMTPTFLVGVVGVVFNARGEILLLEHVFHRAYPWGLPGGGMARGETPEETLRRELREEVGLEVEIDALLTIEPDYDFDLGILQIGYLCRARHREGTAPGTFARLSYEILSARWVSPEPDALRALPGPVLPFHQRLIARALERKAHGLSP